MTKIFEHFAALACALVLATSLLVPSTALAQHTGGSFGGSHWHGGGSHGGGYHGGVEHHGGGGYHPTAHHDTYGGASVMADGTSAGWVIGAFLVSLLIGGAGGVATGVGVDRWAARRLRERQRAERARRQ